MGAYLSTPNIDKHSTDDDNEFVHCGSSQMQGWRTSQEDAHICSIVYDADTSLFAVFDGHGGAEVALYCAYKIPQHLKSIESYKGGDYEKALRDTFLGVDGTLLDEEVIKKMKQMVPDRKQQSETDSERDDEEEDLPLLCREGRMPLSELLAKIHSQNVANDLQKDEEGSSSSSASSAIRYIRDQCAKWKNGPGGSSDWDTERTGRRSGKGQKSADGSSSGGASASGAADQGPSTAGASSASPAKETKPTEDNNVADQSSSEKPAVAGAPKDSETEEKTSEPKNDEEASKKDVVAAKVADSDDSDDDEEEDEEDDDDEDDDSNVIDDEEDGDEDEDSDDNEEDEDEDDEDYDSEFLDQMPEGPGSSSGCTAVVALLSGTELFVANAGDSRCVLCRKGQAVEMSIDHKPEDTEELERIRKAGGKVTMDGRVNGGLNLSRAIGDHAYKCNAKLLPEEQMISPVPDIKRITITPDDEFMILACDGIWNSLTSQQVVDFVGERLRKGITKMSTICEELFDVCLAPNTDGDGTGCDNMTAVIVQFQSKLLEKCRNDSAGDLTITSKKRPISPTTDSGRLDGEANKKLKSDTELVALDQMVGDGARTESYRNAEVHNDKDDNKAIECKQAQPADEGATIENIA